jgi:hypothetical protein
MNVGTELSLGGEPVLDAVAGSALLVELIGPRSNRLMRRSRRFTVHPGPPSLNAAARSHRIPQAAQARCDKLRACREISSERVGKWPSAATCVRSSFSTASSVQRRRGAVLVCFSVTCRSSWSCRWNPSVGGRARRRARMGRAAVELARASIGLPRPPPTRHATERGADAHLRPDRCGTHREPLGR